MEGGLLAAVCGAPGLTRHAHNTHTQVRFSGDQKKIIKDVVSGDVDVGMIRTDLYEAEVAKGIYEAGTLRVLEDRSSETGFPFPHSTALAAPEWSLGAFPWLDWTVSRAVRRRLHPAHTCSRDLVVGHRTCVEHALKKYGALRLRR
jgi:hypothetical protein